MSKSFLIVGNYVINPDLLAFASIETDGEEPRVRLGFAAGSASSGGEIRLAGEAAREILRWLRLNATFLTKPPSSSAGGDTPAQQDSRPALRKPFALSGQSREPQAASLSGSASSFFGRTRGLD
jgi:hypothetical protein